MLMMYVGHGCVCVAWVLWLGFEVGIRSSRREAAKAESEQASAPVLPAATPKMQPKHTQSLCLPSLYSFVCACRVYESSRSRLYHQHEKRTTDSHFVLPPHTAHTPARSAEAHAHTRHAYHLVLSPAPASTAIKARMHQTLRLLKTAVAAAPTSTSSSAPHVAAAAAAAAATADAAAVPWYRRQYKGAKAQNLWQAGWGFSLVMVFVGLPLVGATVQSHLRDQREQRRARMNDAEREEFLRDLYGLDEEEGEEGGVRGVVGLAVDGKKKKV